MHIMPSPQKGQVKNFGLRPQKLDPEKMQKSFLVRHLHRSFRSLGVQEATLAGCAAFPWRWPGCLAVHPPPHNNPAWGLEIQPPKSPGATAVPTLAAEIPIDPRSPRRELQAHLRERPRCSL